MFHVVTNEKTDFAIDVIWCFDIAEVWEYADSTMYLYTRGYEMRQDVGYGVHARLASDLRDIEKKISDRFSGKDQRGIDSVLVYQAEVSRKYEFVLKKRLYGAPSIFSEAAEEVLQNETKWFPAIGSSAL